MTRKEKMKSGDKVRLGLTKPISVSHKKRFMKVHFLRRFSQSVAVCFFPGYEK